MYLVSVVIPTHFRPDRLEIALKSVINQTYQNLEIIVVSDGYDEKTHQYMEKMKEKDSRISFFEYPESQGANYARNLGIENSTGKYIAFLDDDDRWHNTKIEKQVLYMNAHIDVGIVNCAINSIFPDMNCCYQSNMDTKRDMSKDILFGNSIGSTSAVMIRRDVIDKCGMFDSDLPARQDQDYWIRICQHYKVGNISSVELDYYNYLKNKNTDQISFNLEKQEKAFELIVNKYEYLYGMLTDEERNALLVIRYLDLAQSAVKSGANAKAREYAREAWKIKKSLKALYFIILYWIPFDLLIRFKSKRFISN